MAGRWMIGEYEFEGTVFSVGHVKPYSNGQGVLREIVIKTNGSNPLEPDMFIPVTLFGPDAQEAEGTRGCPIKASVRLISRQYEWNDDIRWSLQFTGARIKIEKTSNPGEVPPESDDSHAAYELANSPMLDDMPF